ncbi:MAG: 4-(cytidine 5'-diphospho)-2-C-methyl-D-erythritol kinase [Thermodesulfovibrionia bacterium]|nr:MAG: 4-(cytidine 5'-diphospho)-2-C-methyl-D-erythritol kinase [Thermodesulfovibrionia bacterium]
MLTLKAPAKINWLLNVLGRRNDGYHDIESIIQKISLYDFISFRPSEDLTLKTDLKIPTEQNLVYKTAVLLKKECRVPAGAEIRLKKGIPVAAGLGGGSSDAASTLLGLNRLWSLDLSCSELNVFAEHLGSDVPFFLNGPLAFVSGRGENVTDYRPVKSVNILLVKPPVSISTRWAYGNLKLTKRTTRVDNMRLFVHAVRKVDLRGSSGFHNDLEPVAAKTFPVIEDIKKRMVGEGAILSMMSGSGPTVFGVFSSAKEAIAASKLFNDCWTAVVQTITDEN